MRRKHFFLFISVFTLALSVAAFYLGVKLITWSNWPLNHQGIIWLSLAFFVFLQVLGPILYRLSPGHFNRLFIIHYLTYMSLGLFACMICYTLAADIILALWKFFVSPESTESFEKNSFYAVTFMAFGSVAIGIFQAAVGPRIYKVTVPLKNLPKAFDGFRIVQITDLHVGPIIGKNYTSNVVDLANELKPDLVALTGDFIDGTVPQLKDGIQPLAGLRSKHGSFYITGNHEYIWGADAWIEEFKNLGATVLLNEHVMIEKDGEKFALAGVTDLSGNFLHAKHQSDPFKAIQGLPEDLVKILLAHQPKSYKRAQKAGYDLQLSGHTHGGQFFPFSLIIALVERFYKGLHQYKGMWIYTSRGTGFWGPPLRFTVPSEITLIELRSA